MVVHHNKDCFEIYKNDKETLMHPELFDLLNNLPVLASPVTSDWF